MMIEIRIGRYRLVGLPTTDEAVAHGFDTWRATGHNVESDAAPPPKMPDIEMVPDEIRLWLNQHLPGWLLIKRQRMQARDIARREAVLQFETVKAARRFEATWSGWLRDRYMADLQADAEACRRLADDAFDRFTKATPEEVGNAAFDLVVTERLLRLAVATVERFDAFSTPPGWYRARMRHVRPFGVHFAMVPPNRERRRAEWLGLNRPHVELEPVCIRCRPNEIRIGNWQRLRVRAGQYSVDRTATATRPAFDAAGGYIAIYQPRADEAFLFERHIPPTIEFLPIEIVDWLNHHAPGWRFVDRRRPAYGNVVFQHAVIIFRVAYQAEAFRLQWVAYLSCRFNAWSEREIDLASVSVMIAATALRHAAREQRAAFAESLVRACRRLNFAKRRLVIDNPGSG